MDNKESFVFFKSFYDSISNIPEECQLDIYNAIFSYVFTGKEPELENGIAKALFIAFKPNIDSANARYKASVENGKKGGRPKKEETQEKPKQGKNETQQKPKNNLEETQEKPKYNLNDNVDVNDNVNVNGNNDGLIDKNNLINFLNSENFFEKIEFIQDITEEYNNILKDKGFFVDSYITIVEELDRDVTMQIILAQELIKSAVDNHQGNILEKISTEMVEKVYRQVKQAKEVNDFIKYFISCFENEVINNGKTKN